MTKASHHLLFCSHSLTSLLCLLSFSVCLPASHVHHHQQVIKDRRTNTSKKYGFVTFKEEADGDKALAELNGSELDGSKIDVEKSNQGAKGMYVSTSVFTNGSVVVVKG